MGKGKAAREKGIVHGTDTMCMPLVGLRDMAVLHLNVERVLVRSGGWGWRRRRNNIFRICKVHIWHDVTTLNQVSFKTRRAYVPVPETDCRRSRLRCPEIVDSEKTFENEWVWLVSRYVPFFHYLFTFYLCVRRSFRRSSSRCSPPFHVSLPMSLQGKC